MLADKTILATTMFVTFVAGGATGYAVNSPARSAKPYAVETVFRQQIAELRTEGYADGEVAQAKDYYEQYLGEYQVWWDEFTESHRDNLDLVDERLRARLAELAKKRLGERGPR